MANTYYYDNAIKTAHKVAEILQRQTGEQAHVSVRLSNTSNKKAIAICCNGLITLAHGDSWKAVSYQLLCALSVLETIDN